VPGNKLKGREIGHPPLPQGQAMQHPASELRRIALPRTPLNSGKKKCRYDVCVRLPFLTHRRNGADE
jgi:hypothetical protein